jgi:hypothetical protein
MTSGDPIIVLFGEDEVVRCCPGRFLQKFGEPVLPTGPALGRLFGRFSFFVDGFNERLEEVYAIPEVRRFYRTVLRRWPAWFYFADLRTESLLMMTACVLDDFEAVARHGQDRTTLALEPTQLLQFVSRGFEPMNRMFERAGASEGDIYHRTAEIFRYYGLPSGL